MQLNPTFTQSAVTTITSNPPGRTVIVDNSNYTTPKNFAPPFDLAWAAKSSHTVNVSATPDNPQYTPVQGSPYTIYVFDKWSDGGATSHSITTGSASSTYTANFLTQYATQIAVTQLCQGTAAITGPGAGPYYNAGTTLNLSVTPGTGWNFTGWMGDATGTAMTVTADGEKVITPGFNVTSEPLAISSISPATVVAGGSDLSLTMNGTGFASTVSLCINGSCFNKLATVVSGHQITVTVPAASMTTPGYLYLSVIQTDGNGCSVQSSTIPLAVTATASGPTGTTLSGNYKLTPQNATGLCLDVYGAGTSPGTNVDVWSCNGGTNQSFNLVSQGNGIYLLQPSNAPGLCLDVVGGGASGPGTSVDVWSCNGGSNQQWNLISDGGNIYELAPQNASGLRLDVFGAGTSPGTQIDVWSATGGSNQKWSLTK